MVELCRRYSNRPDLLGPLVRTWQKINQDAPAGDDSDLAPVPGKEACVWRVADRLSLSDVQTMIGSYRSGSTARFLSERYGVSTSTIKRLLREHGVRKQEPRVVA